MAWIQAGQSRRKAAPGATVQTPTAQQCLQSCLSPGAHNPYELNAPVPRVGRGTLHSVTTAQTCTTDWRGSQAAVLSCV